MKHITEATDLELGAIIMGRTVTASIRVLREQFDWTQPAPAPLVRIHTSEYPDMETVARLQNEGFDQAMALVLADDPSAADEWLAEHDAKVWDEGVKVAGSYGHEDDWTNDMTPYSENPYRNDTEGGIQ